MVHTKHGDDKRRLIIGAPLMLIVVFCFGFFLMHPDGAVSHAAVSDTSTGKKTPADSSTSASQLQNLPQAAPAQTESSVSAVSSGSTTSGASENAPATSASQAASKSSTTNNQPGTSQAKDDSNKPAPTAGNQQGLIQAVFNNLLNGR